MEDRYARYKHIGLCIWLLAVDLQRQLLLGTFVYAMDHLSISSSHNIERACHEHVIFILFMLKWEHFRGKILG
ncbi:hypothetical protein [Candidatus Nitrotoga arctica]|nr:hypothetical protein [Candidatus Nitrotoga arctica]